MTDRRRLKAGDMVTAYPGVSAHRTELGSILATGRNLPRRVGTFSIKMLWAGFEATDAPTALRIEANRSLEKPVNPTVVVIPAVPGGLERKHIWAEGNVQVDDGIYLAEQATHLLSDYLRLSRKEKAVFDKIEGGPEKVSDHMLSAEAARRSLMRLGDEALERLVSQGSLTYDALTPAQAIFLS